MELATFPAELILASMGFGLRLNQDITRGGGSGRHVRAAHSGGAG